MTHDELLENIDYFLEYEPKESQDWASAGIFIAKKLRAVVELHKPIELNVGDEFHYEGCLQCDRQYPCPTIQAIEEQLK